MTRLLLAAVFAAIVTTSALAGEGTRNFFDSRGKKIGSMTRYGNTTTFYDSNGDRIGSAVTMPGGTTEFRDRLGRRESTISGPLSLGRQPR